MLHGCQWVLWPAPGGNWRERAACESLGQPTHSDPSLYCQEREQDIYSGELVLSHSLCVLLGVLGEG